MEKNMAKTIDARGLACPQPVLLTRKGLADNDQIIAIVDNETAQQNVARFAEKAGCQVQVEKRTDGIYLNITKGIAPLPEASAACANTPTTGPLVLTIPGEFMGRGDDELGHVLIRAFFHTLGETQPSPETIIFFNSGVKLTIEGSPVLEDLRDLHDKGIQILVCGTCLGHYGIKDKVAVGEVSNMYVIAETLLQAGKVVGL
jgi:selenium metabolism protein YedF